MTGDLIGQFHYPSVKVISEKTCHGDRHRIVTKHLEKEYLSAHRE